jgi:hypothetical protein
MNKVAKLVEVSLLVRVIVDENATEDQIIAASYDKFQDKLDNRELGDNLVSIEDDTECPFGTFDSDIEFDDEITKEMVKNARHYLCADSDKELRKMIRNIMDCEDGTQLIDYIDGVVVWEKIEYSFSVDAFIEHIS